MTDDITPHDDGSAIALELTADNRMALSLTSVVAPTTPPIHLTLAEVEALVKRLGVEAAKMRGKAAKL